MGNTDMTANGQFMTNYNDYAIDFLKQTPLYWAEDIKFPLSTEGACIVDASGRRVKLAGGNWSGGHLCRHCVDGLECRPLKDIAIDLRYKFNLNCIRLTFSLQLFFDNNKVESKYLTANPELIGKTSIEIFDETIKVLTETGIMVILNNHNSTSMWCCTNEDGDGLWWTRQYPEYKFFQCNQMVARRYKNNPLVIGFDIRNELRKAHGLEATWGDGNPLTDWHRAAKICGEKVLKIAPDWLIIVAGLNFQLDLTCIQKQPLQFSVKNKLVYSGHFYSFSWPPNISSFSYESFKKKFFNTQTFVRGYGVPFILGQFGNNKRDTKWNYLIKYLKETDIDWIYWPIDGFKCDPNDPDKDQTYGLFTRDFLDIRNPDIFNDIRIIGAPEVIHLNNAQKKGQGLSLIANEKAKSKIFTPEGERQRWRNLLRQDIKQHHGIEPEHRKKEQKAPIVQRNHQQVRGNLQTMQMYLQKSQHNSSEGHGSQRSVGATVEQAQKVQNNLNTPKPRQGRFDKKY